MDVVPLSYTWINLEEVEKQIVSRLKLVLLAEGRDDQLL